MTVYILIWFYSDNKFTKKYIPGNLTTVFFLCISGHFSRLVLFRRQVRLIGKTVCTRTLDGGNDLIPSFIVFTASATKNNSTDYKYHLQATELMLHKLWCLTPTLAIFQLYCIVALSVTKSLYTDQSLCSNSYTGNLSASCWETENPYKSMATVKHVFVISLYVVGIRIKVPVLHYLRWYFKHALE